MADGDRGDGDGGVTDGDLRRRAEQRILETVTEEVVPLSLEGAKGLLHELRVHQIELEMQNEELRRAQLALDASRARYFDLYDLAPVGYVSLCEKGLILEANLRACVMVGTARGALVKQPMTRFINENDQDIYYLHRKTVFETGEPQSCELRLKGPGADEVWARFELAFAKGGEDGAPMCMVALSDITEQRNLQIALAQADRMSSMGVLAAGVAHEINNPLTYVLYNIVSLTEDLPVLAGTVGRLRSALRDAVGDEAMVSALGERKEVVDPVALEDMVERAVQAAEGVQRIKEISRGLSSFSRVETHDLSMVDLGQAARHAINMAGNEIRCRAALSKDIGPVPGIMATEGKLAQVFINLIVNAAQAIDDGDVDDNRITIRTWTEAGQVCGEVSDTGCGIAPQNLGRIFEPFFTTKGADRGTGLGLAVTRRIVREFGGDIHVESKVGEGTRVVMRFPVGRQEARPTAQKKIRGQKVRGRILVVDDEKFVRSALEKLIGAEHEVVAVDSGRAAKTLLGADSNFNLVLCDLMMPDVSGIELHAWLVKNHPCLGRNLVFISGGAFTARTREYLAEVPNLRIDKPFDPKELPRLVNDLVIASRE